MIAKGDWDEFYVRVSGNFTVKEYTELNKILEGSGILYTSILHKITRIPSLFLVGCEHIPNSLILPSNIKEIDNYVFAFCSRLTSITIPDSVTSIGEYAFYGCSSLTSITIPEGIVSIGYGAFQQCSNLEEIKFQGTKARWKSIKKHPAWRRNSSIRVIHCTDGDIQYK